MQIRRNKKAALWLSSLAFGFLAAGLLLSYGCWSTGPSVAGIIRLDGQPLPWGSIRFVPVEGTPGGDAGSDIEKGKYRIRKDLEVGQYKVEIRSPRNLPNKLKINPAMPTELVPDAVEVLPPEYHKQSKLLKTVQPGANVIDFDLKGAKPGK